MSVNLAQFAQAVLQDLHIPPTPRAVRGFVGWENAEGGDLHNSARFNPLNTTQREPGYKTFQSVGVGSAPIGIYNSFGQGVKATVQTLRNGRYGGILDALRTNPGGLAAAIDHSPWGTHGAGLYSAIANAHVGKLGPAPTVDMSGGASTPAQTLIPKQNGEFDASGFATDQRRSAILGDLLKQSGAPPILSDLLASNPADFTTQSEPAVTIPGSVTPKALPPGLSGGLRTIVQRATELAKAHLPYEWGGGHQPGYNLNHPTPVDCSGAVSAVLGINPRVASQFESWGQPGRGRNVTIYAKSTHVIMEINGHFFGTSGLRPNGYTGAGWIPSSVISPSYLSGFVARHPHGL